MVRKILLGLNLICYSNQNSTELVLNIFSFTSHCWFNLQLTGMPWELSSQDWFVNDLSQMEVTTADLKVAYFSVNSYFSHPFWLKFTALPRKNLLSKNYDTARQNAFLVKKCKQIKGNAWNTHLIMYGTQVFNTGYQTSVTCDSELSLIWITLLIH